MQVIIVEVGRFIGPQYMGTNGLTAVEWLFSIAVGSLSIPIGYVCRVIPVPQSGLVDAVFSNSSRRSGGLNAHGKGDVPGGGGASEIELAEEQNLSHHSHHHAHSGTGQKFVQLVEEDEDDVLDEPLVSK